MIICYRIKYNYIRSAFSTILVTGHLIFGTVYLTMLSSLIQLTHLNIDFINSGNTKILHTILKPKLMEPEVEAGISY